MLRAALCRRRLFTTVSTRSQPSLLSIHPEVQQALAEGRPVVALESTIVSHGMPFPENFHTAQLVESIVRQEGAVPATIAIAKGKVKVGLSAQELEHLATLGQKAYKTSRRDLAAVVGWNLDGATTVSGTMWAAHQAGIRLFVTGGIGGVHRGGESNMDVSADLTELGRTPVSVVCAGVKSILDIGRTLEYLETQGVPVVSIGQRPDFPAFFSPSSGYKSPWHAETTEKAAQMMAAQHKLQLQNGIVFGVPIPEEDAVSFADIPAAIELAVSESVGRGVQGKAITPFLLGRVNELTQDIALIKNNARVGSRIAVAYQQLVRRFSTSSPSRHAAKKMQPLFIGGTAMDIVSKLKPANDGKSYEHAWEPFFHTSSPCTIRESLGGVARNAAECCFRVASGHAVPHSHPSRESPTVAAYPFSGPAPILISPVGDDLFGQSIFDSLNRIRMPTEGLVVAPNHSTAVYNATLDPQGKLILAGAAMDIFTSKEAFGPDVVGAKLDEFLHDQTPIVSIDANPLPAVISETVQRCRRLQVPVWFEPTSVVKCINVMRDSIDAIAPLPFPSVMYTSPNTEELVAMSETISSYVQSKAELVDLSRSFVYEVGPSGELRGMFKTHEAHIRAFGELLKPLSIVLTVVPTIFLKLGKDGILLAQRTTTHPETFFDQSTSVRLRYYLPESSIDRRIVNVTGAGDSFVGALIAGLTHGVMEDLRQRKPTQHRESMYQKHIRLFHRDQKPEPHTIDSLIRRGREAAELSLLHDEAVHPKVAKLMVRGFSSIAK